MKRLQSLAALLLTVTLLSCTTVQVPPPQPLSEQARRLVDPMIGYSGPGDGQLAEQHAAAWGRFTAGRIAQAETDWRRILEQRPQFEPAIVGLAAVAIALDQPRRAEELLAGVSSYPASVVYRAELAAARGDVVTAAESLQPVVGFPGLPTSVSERFEQLRQLAVEELLLRAETGDVPGRIRLFHQALALAPESRETRLELVDLLIAQRSFADARSTLEPLIESAAALNRVQASLAEIEIGEGRFQPAMRRYERLVELTGDTVYRERLEAARRLWHESNLPRQFQLAVRAPALTREQMAVLFFWKVPSIRFARNLGQPPIIVDMEEVTGREELIRALQLGLLPLDSVTRSARPRRQVNAGEFLEAAVRALGFVSNDPCTAASATAGSPAAALRACGIDTRGLERDRSQLVSGEVAGAILDELARLDHSA
jgi:thioredoxin-like negative regulator of GroEL